MLTGSSDAIVVRIFGDDLDVLRDEGGGGAGGASRAVDGLVDVHVELQDDVPQVQVKVDLAEAQRYGLKPGDVRRAAATLVASEEVGDIFRGGKAYDVNVWSTPETRNSLTSIRELPIDTPDGGQVRLERCGRRAASRRRRTSSSARTSSRRIDVSANVQRTRSRLRRATTSNERLETGRLPARVPRRGARRVRGAAGCAEAPARLRRSSPAIGIFLLLQASFGSWRLATLSFLTLPMALVGGVLAAYRSAAASSRSARWSASSRCSGSPRATASC